MAATVQHGAIAGQAGLRKPRASASFDARRLYAMRVQLSQAKSESWSVACCEFIEAECRALGAGLIAGEQVSA